MSSVQIPSFICSAVAVANICIGVIFHIRSLSAVLSNILIKLDWSSLKNRHLGVSSHLNSVILNPPNCNKGDIFISFVKTDSCTFFSCSYFFNFSK